MEKVNNNTEMVLIIKETGKTIESKLKANLRKKY